MLFRNQETPARTNQEQKNLERERSAANALRFSSEFGEVPSILLLMIFVVVMLLRMSAVRFYMLSILHNKR